MLAAPTESSGTLLPSGRVFSSSISVSGITKEDLQKPALVVLVRQHAHKLVFFLGEPQTLCEILQSAYALDQPA